jgi:hypothetical protein
MIIDKDLEFSNKQTVAINIGNVASTNVIDLIKLGIARGTPVKVLVQMTTALDSGNDGATLQAKLQTHDDADFGAAVDLIDTGAVAQATCVAGYKLIEIDLPWNNCLEFVRIYYTVGTSNATAGNVQACLILDTQTNKQSVWA